MPTLVVWMTGVLLAGYALHRLGLWMEARGWIYYRHARGRAAMRDAMLEMQALMDPGKRHILEQVRRVDDEQDQAGDGRPAVDR